MPLPRLIQNYAFQYRLFVIDEKGILNAIEHDKYVRLRLFMGINGNAYYFPRRLAPD
jgi:hypothetical protein